LPISVIGTRKVLPAKGAKVTNGCSVRVVIHRPIDPQAYGEERRDELIEDVRNAIGAELPPPSEA
jgi:hypothetical protein